ncbi:MAG: NAD(P)/FAD-dependent oxidoreductase [Planctomycetota bacterium]
MKGTPDNPKRPPFDRPHIVVVGCGFGGLSFTRSFRGDATVTIIDRQNHHLFQPLLYQVAMAGLSAPDIAEPIRSIFRNRPNIGTMMDTVEGIDLANQHIETELGGTVSYDYLVLGIGGRTSYFGNDHWAEHAPGIKTLEDAMRVRRMVLTSYELAEAIDDPEERKKLTTIVVVGGGATGVELAGSMAELSRVVFKRDFRRINPAESRVLLVDGGERLLSAFPEELSASGQRQLEGLGVEVMLETRVQHIDEEGVELDNGQRIETRNVLWGGGIQAPGLTRKLGVELGGGGRVQVGPDLSIPGHPEAFVIGDVADVTLPDGSKAPGLAPAAMQMGKYVAKHIRRELRSGRPIPVQERGAFTYRDKGTMATIGRTHAIADIGPLHFGGFFAWMAWLAVHLLLLIGFRNRVVVLIQWAYAYLSFRRGARIIFGRDKLVDEIERELLDKSDKTSVDLPPMPQPQEAGLSQ